ncbi:hypothetical protein SAFG77S_09093 [Streptomyces afghaniensis]
MKEIIYLDTGLLNSYIAQIHDGLPTSTNNERNEEVKDSKEMEEGYKSRSFFEAKVSTGEFEIPWVFKSPSGEILGRFQPGNYSGEKISLSQLESAKEIISKQLHDNALEIFEKHLSNKEELITDIWKSNMEIDGSFVKITKTFKIIDFSYLNSIIQTDKLMGLMFMQEEEKIADMESQSKTETNNQIKSRQKVLIQQAKSKLDAQKKSMKSSMETTEKSLRYLNEILPTEAFLLMDRVIAPLKNEFLREKSNQLMFKYGNNGSSIDITLIGKVTSKVKNVEMPNFNSGNPFFEFPGIINGILSPFGVIKKGDNIVTPIAIYFE